MADLSRFFKNSVLIMYIYYMVTFCSVSFPLTGRQWPLSSYLASAPSDAAELLSCLAGIHPAHSRLRPISGPDGWMRGEKAPLCDTLCVFTVDWDSKGQDANWQSSPQGTDSNAGTWGRALAVFVPIGRSLDLVRAAFLKSQRRFGWRGRARLRFASFTECRWVSIVTSFQAVFFHPPEVAFLLPCGPGGSSPFAWPVVLVRNLNCYFSEEVILGHSW